MKSLPTTYTAPGLVDVQVNGYAGFDFTSGSERFSAEEFHRVRLALLRRGVVTILPTFTTDDSLDLLARARRYSEIVSADRQLEEAFPRLHIEGPFISPVDGPRGAHPKAYCLIPRAMPDLIDRLHDASGGRVGLVTLAPELPGAMDLIRRCRSRGIRVAIGHSQAPDETIAQAVEAGATLSTHLGNGSHQMLPRLSNYVQTQLADDRLTATFIADGHHMPLTTLKNFIRAKTPRRCILITDAIGAAEMPPGVYFLGKQQVQLERSGRVSHPGQPNLAGSALTMDQAILNVYLHCDVTWEEAWAMASTIPASALGLPAPSAVTVEISEQGFRNSQAVTA